MPSVPKPVIFAFLMGALSFPAILVACYFVSRILLVVTFPLRWKWGFVWLPNLGERATDGRLTIAEIHHRRMWRHLYFVWRHGWKWRKTAERGKRE